MTIMAVAFQGTVFTSALRAVGTGVGVTIVFTLATMATSLVIGLGLAMGRISQHAWTRRLVGLWVDVFRASPLLVQLLWLYYVVPAATGIRPSAVITAFVAFVLNQSAFNAETLRAGIESLPAGQQRAGLALGMTRWQTLRRVILPQATRRVLPPLSTTWVQLFQNTSVVSFIGVGDMTFKALQMNNETYASVPVFTALAVGYVVLAYPQAKLADLVYRRVRVQ